ncbi:hypothetical protein BH11BAC3_BH11BAC3_16960 [soil metagenome]
MSYEMFEFGRYNHVLEIKSLRTEFLKNNAIIKCKWLQVAEKVQEGDATMMNKVSMPGA